MNLYGIDDTDKKILNLIKHNARISYTKIAEEVGLSRIAVKNRIRALESSGIIKGYETIIDETNLLSGTRFYMDIEILPDRYNDVVDELKKHDMLRQIYSVTGESKIHVTGYADNSQVLDSYAREVFYKIKGVKRVVWNTVLSTIKDFERGII